MEHDIKCEPIQHSENFSMVNSKSISQPTSDRTISASSAAASTPNKSTKRKQHFGGFLDVDLQTVDLNPPKKKRKRRPKIPQEKILSINEIKGSLGIKKTDILDNISSSFQRDTTKVIKKKDKNKNPTGRKRTLSISEITVIEDAINSPANHGSVIKTKKKRPQGIKLF